MKNQQVFVLLAVLVRIVNGDWVKLPEISNKPKGNYKIQSIASFADLPPSSVMATSDLLSSVFSYDRKKIQSTNSTTTTTTSTTTEPSATRASFKQQSYTKRYYPSTVTSTPVKFEHRVDNEDTHMEAVDLMPATNLRPRVIYINNTMPMKVQPLSIKEDIKTIFELPQQQPEAIDDDDRRLHLLDEDDGINLLDDDDGVTVLDEDEELTSSEQAVSDEEYYEDDDENLTPSTSTSTTTTTTKAPRKAAKKQIQPKPQRRVMQVVKTKAGLHNHLSFENFFKFIKNIQNSFATRTAKNINDKIRMLREFRDNLMLTINQRIKTLWKAKPGQKKNKRSKRTLGGGDSGGGWMEPGAAMEFPSAEGALLSISFLTFAVFLIKLVLVS